MRIRPILLLTLLSAATAVGFGTHAVASEGGTPAGSPSTSVVAVGMPASLQSTVESKASDLLGQPVVLSRIASAPHGMAEYADAKTGDQYLIEESTGLVRSWAGRAQSNRSAGPAGSMKSDEALGDSVLAMVREHFGRWQNAPMTAERVSEGIRADGSAHETVRFTFREWIGDVPSCNMLELVVNPASGELIGYLQDYGPVDVDRSAKLSDKEAISVVAEAAHMPVHEVVEAEKMVWRLPATGEPHYVLRVRLRTGDDRYGAECEGFVDLTSGELLQLGL